MRIGGSDIESNNELLLKNDFTTHLAQRMVHLRLAGQQIKQITVHLKTQNVSCLNRNTQLQIFEQTNNRNRYRTLRHLDLTLSSQKTNDHSCYGLLQYERIETVPSLTNLEKQWSSIHVLIPAWQRFHWLFRMY